METVGVVSVVGGSPMITGMMAMRAAAIVASAAIKATMTCIHSFVVFGVFSGVLSEDGFFLPNLYLLETVGKTGGK